MTIERVYSRASCPVSLGDLAWGAGDLLRRGLGWWVAELPPFLFRSTDTKRDGRDAQAPPRIASPISGHHGSHRGPPYWPGPVAALGAPSSGVRYMVVGGGGRVC
jgi:hypothetical protein